MTELSEKRFELIKQGRVMEARARFRAYRRLISPTLKDGWFRREVEEAAQQWWNRYRAGERPVLLLTTPPQHGKSLLIIDFISWIAGQDPTLRTIFGSYSDRLGVRANLRLQRIFDSERFREIFPDTRISGGGEAVAGHQRNREIIEYIDKGGFFRNVTAGGSITGDSLDCVVEGTLITTDLGMVCVEEINTGGRQVKALSFNGKSLSYERITSVTRNSSVGIYKITSKSGRFFEATADHLVFTRNRGYVEASLLSKGDVLMRAVRKELSKDGLRRVEVDKGWREKTLLLKCVRSKTQVIAKNHPKGLRGLWRNVQRTGCWIRDLLPCLLGKASSSSHDCFCASSEGGCLSGLPANIHIDASRAWALCDLLLKKVCGTRAFKKHVGNWKSDVEKWRDTSPGAATFRKSVSKSKRGGAGTGWTAMHSLFGFGKASCPSYRWMADEQLFLKSGDVVSGVPRLCAQNDEIGFDYVEDFVESVERSRERAVTYDITVANNHNFFANGLLVHNCGIIDDPVKGRAEANSDTMREKIWEWYTDDFSTRFSDRAGLLLIMTRWHIDDIAARILEHDPAAKVLNFEAIAERDERHRMKDEPLFPELKSLEFLIRKKRLMRLASWKSLYQGSPIIDEGNMFRPDAIRVIDVLPKGIRQVVRYWDKAGTEDGGAYTAGAKLCLTEDERVIIADLTRAQLSAGRREQLIKQIAELDGVAVHVWVEQEPGSGGKESAENTIKNLIGFVAKAENVTGSKVVRAEPFAAYVEAGNVCMLKGAWNKDFLDEMRLFPNGKFKDQIDAASGAFNKLTLGQKSTGMLDFLRSRKKEDEAESLQESEGTAPV